jgi:hypothetical protein
VLTRVSFVGLGCWFAQCPDLGFLRFEAQQPHYLLIGSGVHDPVDAGNIRLGEADSDALPLVRSRLQSR